VTELVQMFLSDGLAHLGRLKEQLAKKDSKAMAATLHAFKGSALQIGAMQVADILIGMEIRLEVNEMNAVRESMASLEAAFTAVSLEMEEPKSGRPIAEEDTHP
jgi:HPt (histidine-containing phosphotransfer) domain-containing protein